MSRLIPATYESNWTSAIGALAGVLRALGGTYSDSEIGALSGHAFRLAVTSGPDGEIGADGPNHFAAHSALVLYENLGWRFAAIEAAPAAPDFKRRRQEALKRVRKSIDRGRPVLLFGLHLPEFGVVRGYDRDDLIASTTVSGQYGERIPVAQWPSPARPQPVRVFVPEKQVRVERERIDRSLLTFVVNYARRGEPTAVPGMTAATTGLLAYDRWATILESDAQISPHGQAYCIQALQSARGEAASYFRQSETRALADDAAAAYHTVVLELSRMATLFPYPNGGDVLSAGSRRAGAMYIRRAGEAETRAVQILEAFTGAPREGSTRAT